MTSSRAASPHWAHLAGLRAWKSRGSEARKLDYLKEMLELLDERGWPHADKAQLLVFMEGVIHLTEDGSSREYEEWENTLEQAKEAGRMYVSIMERKGIEKGFQLGEARGFPQGSELCNAPPDLNPTLHAIL